MHPSTFLCFKSKIVHARQGEALFTQKIFFFWTFSFDLGAISLGSHEI